MPYNHGDIVLIGFVWRLGQTRAYVTRPHQIVLTTGTAVNEATVLNAVWLGPYREVSRRLASPKVPEGIFARRLYPTPDPLPIPRAGDPGGAVFNNNPLPAQVAGLIRLHKAQPGPPRKGLIFVPYLPEAHNDGTGRLTAAGLLNLQVIAGWMTFAVPFAAGAITGFVTPTLWSRRHSTQANIVGSTVSPTFATQRRRACQGGTTPTPYGAGPPSV